MSLVLFTDQNVDPFGKTSISVPLERAEEIFDGGGVAAVCRDPIFRGTPGWGKGDLKAD